MEIQLVLLSGNTKFVNIMKDDLKDNNLFSKLLDIEKWQIINFIFDDIKYENFTIELYDKIEKIDNKTINVILIDVLELIKNADPNTILEWNYSIFDKFNQNISECEYYYLEISGEIEIDNDKYYINFIIKYLYSWIFKKINYVQCRGNNCIINLPKCRERYCSDCNPIFNEKKEILFLCFNEITYGHESILNRNYMYWLDDFGDEGYDDDNYIRNLFDSSKNCKLSALNLNKQNLIEIISFTKIIK